MSEATESNRKHRRCAGQRQDGQRCSGTALPSSDYCFAHDPARREERAAARSKGGRNKANVVRLRGLVPPRLMPVFDRLETALEEVHGGTLDPKQAQAMASLARAMVAVLTSGELEERMRRVEAAMHGAGEDGREWA